LINRYNKWNNNMIDKNTIIRLGYQLATIIIQLMLWLLLNNGNKYNKVISLT